MERIVEETLRIAELLFPPIDSEAPPGTGVAPRDFWKSLEATGLDPKICAVPVLQLAAPIADARWGDLNDALYIDDDAHQSSSCLTMYGTRRPLFAVLHFGIDRVSNF